MKTLNIVFKMSIILSLCILMYLSYLVAWEAESLIDEYTTLDYALSEQPCYAELDVNLQLKFNRLKDDAMIHSMHMYDNWRLVLAVSIVIFVLTIVIYVKSILKPKIN